MSAVCVCVCTALLECGLISPWFLFSSEGPQMNDELAKQNIEPNYISGMPLRNPVCPQNACSSPTRPSFPFLRVFIPFLRVFVVFWMFLLLTHL
jgi:hypothetical protein